MIEKRKGFKFPVADGFGKYIILWETEFVIYEQYGTWFLADKKDAMCNDRKTKESRQWISG